MANNNSNSGNDPLSDAELKDQPAPQGQSKTKGQCIICGQNTMRNCTICSISFICIFTCQYGPIIDGLWAEHLKRCVDQSPRTTADILLKSIIINQVPTGQKTLTDYRFDACISNYSKRQLVGAYKSVMLYHNISTRELDIWMKENVLFKRMSTLFYVYPGILLTHELKWFCNCAISEKDDLSGRVRRLLLHTIADKEGGRI
ncbi:hypothetical protein CGCVW01_v010365 [Colletotrichum viniferum]|nr:hypothetical protein CGCVW01_v010365 [Colletotrichum viniferum]